MKKTICVVLALLMLMGVFALGANAFCFDALEELALQIWPPDPSGMHPWPNPNSSDPGEFLYSGFLFFTGFLLFPLMLYEPLFRGVMEIISWLAMPLFLLVSIAFRA
ncbi:MAG: hypothetical protein FWE98_00870 [Oscillospiraceae bacterium]|nr:hypothetical protein [Oscillospiraceae bacterium]